MQFGASIQYSNLYKPSERIVVAYQGCGNEYTPSARLCMAREPGRLPGSCGFDCLVLEPCRSAYTISWHIYNRLKGLWT